jgi:hypothetical protein
MHSLASRTGSTPFFRWPAILLGMLLLSIGWVIRGDYGHEFGAMMPGLLYAVGACLFSGRKDSREKVLSFAISAQLAGGSAAGICAFARSPTGASRRCNATGCTNNGG